jgi:hypothetical protein
MPTMIATMAMSPATDSTSEWRHTEMDDDFAFSVCCFVVMVCIVLFAGMVAGVGHAMGFW